MDERELTLRAIRYLTHMAAGVNPFDGKPIPERELLQDERIKRCLSYSAGVMAGLLDSGDSDVFLPGKRERKSRKASFALGDEELAKFVYSDRPIGVAEMTRQLNALCPGVADGTMKKLSPQAITGWLISKGLMEIVDRPDGGTQRRPTSTAAMLGIRCEHRRGMHGEYDAVLYTREGQEFIVDNFAAILAYRMPSTE